MINKIEVGCFYCKKEFKVWASKAKQKKIFCEKKCYNDYIKTDEYKIEAKKRYLGEEGNKYKKIAKINLKKYNDKIKNGELEARKHTEEHKEYIKKLYTGRKITWNNKIKESHWSKNEITKEIVLNKLREKYWSNKEKMFIAKTKMSETKSELIANGKLEIITGTNGKYFSKKNNKYEKFDSLFELKKMISYDEDSSIIKWTKKHGIKIPFKFEDQNKNYIPDFLIETNYGFILQEIKSSWTFNRCGKNLQLEKLNLKKQEVGIEFCLKNNYQFKLEIVELNYKEKKQILNYICK